MSAVLSIPSTMKLSVYCLPRSMMREPLLQKGYRLSGRILRPSMVHVAGKPSGTNNNEGDN